MMCGAVVTAAAAYVYKMSRSVEQTPINVQLSPEPVAMAAVSGMWSCGSSLVHMLCNDLRVDIICASSEACTDFPEFLLPLPIPLLQASWLTITGLTVNCGLAP